MFCEYMIYFFQIPQAIEEEAVRIFVEFEKQESAIKGIGA